MDAAPGTPAHDRLEVLSILVEAYEAEHHPIPLPDPIGAIEFHMERLGLTRKDLTPYIGSRGRVSEIMNRKRPLTLRMIRNLEEALGIPAEILVQHYDLEEDASLAASSHAYARRTLEHAAVVHEEPTDAAYEASSAAEAQADVESKDD
jgi:HTH-type transcriptional regulator / antitoxin HigA